MIDSIPHALIPNVLDLKRVPVDQENSSFGILERRRAGGGWHLPDPGASAEPNYSISPSCAVVPGSTLKELIVKLFRGTFASLHLRVQNCSLFMHASQPVSVYPNQYASIPPVQCFLLTDYSNETEHKW